MAEQRIAGRDGSVTVISDSYGVTTISGPPSPVEDPSKWVVRKLTDAEIQKRRGWTAEQLKVSRARLGFPRGEDYTTTSWWPKTTRRTQEREVEKWEEDARACGLLK